MSSDDDIDEDAEEDAVDYFPQVFTSPTEEYVEEDTDESADEDGVEVSSSSTLRTNSWAARRWDDGCNQDPAGTRGKAMGKRTYKGK